MTFVARLTPFLTDLAHSRILAEWRLGIVLAALLFFPSAALSSSSVGRAESASSPITVGSEIDFPPYAVVDADGRASGFSVQLLEATSAVMGLSIDVRPGPWPNVLAEFKEGRLDLLPLVALSPQRAEMATFTKPHTIAYDSFFVRRGAKPLRTLADAKNKAVVVMSSDAAHEQLLASGVAATLIETKNIPDAMRLLASGRHDAVLVPELLGYLVLRDLKLEKVIEAGPPVPDYQRRFAFAVQTGNFDLRDKLEQGLAIVRVTGQYDSLYTRWFGDIKPKAILSWQEILWGGGAAVLLSLLPLGWSLSLRRQVARRTESLTAEIATRQAAQALLSQSEAHYRLIVECAELATWDWDIKSGRVDFNDYWARMRGSPLDEITPHVSEWEQRVHPDDLPGVRATLETHFADHTPLFQTEYRSRTKSGQWVWVLDRGSVVERNADGSPSRMAGTEINITERKEAEAALRESETRFRQMFENNAAALLLVDPNSGSIVDANPAASRFYGYPVDRLRAMSINQINTLSAEEIAARRAQVAHLECNFFVFPHRLANGEVRTVEVHSSPINTGERTLLFSIVHDVTDRYAAEEKLRAASRYARSLIEASLDSLVTIDAEGKILDVNTAAETVTGVHRDKLIGSDFCDYFTDAEKARAGYRLVFTQNQLTDYPLAIRHTSGRITEVLYNATIYRDEEGNVAGVFAAARDITARKLAEEKLRASEERMRLFFERQIVGMAITSPQKGWVQVNDQLCRMLGYSREEISRMTWAELTYPDDLAKDVAQFERLLAQEIDEYSLEKRFIRKDGDVVYTDLSVGCVRNGDGSAAYVLALMADISERKRVEAQIMAANRQLAAQARQLEGVNAELKQFAYAASHDLRAPLRTVMSYLSLIVRKLGPDIDNETREFIGFATDGAKRMDAMIVGLLDYSRTGRHDTPFEPVALEDVVQESLENLRVSIQEVGAGVVVAPGLPTVTGDRTELVRLFQNLLSNAVKYRVSDRTVEVSVGWRDAGSEWVVWVKDNGIGIDPAESGRVFEIFRRLVSASKYEGCGIGLAICSKVAEHHGGRIWLESVPDEGSTFLVAFPKTVSP